VRFLEHSQVFTTNFSCAIILGFERPGLIRTVSFKRFITVIVVVTVIVILPYHHIFHLVPIFSSLKVRAGPRSGANYVSLRRVCF